MVSNLFIYYLKLLLLDFSCWLLLLVFACLFSVFHVYVGYTCDTLKLGGPIDNSSTRGILVGFAYLDTTISHPIH